MGRRGEYLKAAVERVKAVFNLENPPREEVKEILKHLFEFLQNTGLIGRIKVVAVVVVLKYY